MSEHRDGDQPRRQVLVVAVVGTTALASALLARWGFNTVRLAARTSPDGVFDELVRAIESIDSPLACEEFSRGAEPLIDLGAGAVISRLLACDILAATSTAP